MLKGDDEFEYGYFEEKGYFKNCSLENVTDVSYIAVPLRFVVCQYLDVLSDKNYCFSFVNHALIEKNIDRMNSELDKLVKSIDGRVSALDLIKNNISMILLKKDSDGFFREISTGVKISTSPAYLTSMPLCDLDYLNSICSGFIKEDIDEIFDNPIVLNSMYMFEVNDVEREIIERYTRNCCKDMLKRMFKKMNSEAIKGNDIAISMAYPLVSSMDSAEKYLLRKRNRN